MGIGEALRSVCRYTYFHVREIKHTQAALMVRLSKEETILLGASFALTLTWLAKPLQLTGQSLKLANPIDITLQLCF